jgi:hypothetical protein
MAMAAKPLLDDKTVTSIRADGAAGLRLVTSSLTHTQLAAEIGRSLQTLYQACLNDALSDKLAALVRQLQEREDGSAPARQR